MEISNLESNILMFTFKEGYGLNIIALIQKNKACLIDIGNEQQAVQVKQHLDCAGITVTDIFFTHLHSDHCWANSHFSNSQFHVGKKYQENFRDNVIDPSFTPQNLHSDGDRFHFGSFEIKILETPGHSCESLSFSINNKYFVVGDTLIFDYEGNQYLPYVGHDSTFEEYLTSINRIKSFSDHIFIPGHGLILDSRASILKACNIVEVYLSRLEILGRDASLDELMDDSKNILVKFHEMTLNNQFPC